MNIIIITFSFTILFIFYLASNNITQSEDGGLEKIVKKNKKISVIIPAHNEENYIGKAISSLLNQTTQPYEIIVVANSCTDKTAEIAKKYGDKLRVYETQDSGAAIARNYGAKKATGDILVFHDADSYSKENLLEKVEESIDRGYVGGKVKILPAGKEKSTLYDIFWKADNAVDKTLFYKFGVPNICSYSPLVFCEKKDFEKVGGFDTDVVATEEIRLLNKLRKKGKLNFLEDSAVYTSERRAKKTGFFYGGFWVPFYHFFFPKSKKMPYSNVR